MYQPSQRMWDYENFTIHLNSQGNTLNRAQQYTQYVHEHPAMITIRIVSFQNIIEKYLI